MKSSLNFLQFFPSFTKLSSVERTNEVRHIKGATNIEERTKFNLRDVEVPSEFREPFVVSGYRRPGITALECVKSVVSTCNETINVWSHVFAAVHFLHLSSNVWSLNLADAFLYPLLSFVFGLSTMLVMSFSAHAFNSMSCHVRHVCFFFDYAAISVFTFTAGLGFFFYSRPLGTGLILFESPWLFISSSALISLACTYLCSASRHRWIKHKFVIRTGTFLVSFIFNTLPYTCRLLMCASSVECSFSSQPFFKRHVLFYCMAALANVSRLPERWVEKSFDFIGQSHNLLHVFAAIGAEDEFIALKLDMENRRDLLQVSVNIQPAFWNTLGLTALVISANIFIVMWFSRSVKSEGEDDSKKKIW